MYGVRVPVDTHMHYACAMTVRVLYKRPLNYNFSVLHCTLCQVSIQRRPLIALNRREMIVKTQFTQRRRKRSRGKKDHLGLSTT